MKIQSFCMRAERTKFEIEQFLCELRVIIMMNFKCVYWEIVQGKKTESTKTENIQASSRSMTNHFAPRI